MSTRWSWKSKAEENINLTHPAYLVADDGSCEQVGVAQYSMFTEIVRHKSFGVCQRSDSSAEGMASHPEEYG